MNIQNLQRLYEVGQKILREYAPIHFGSWECGTFACLGGWYQRATDVREHFDAWANEEPCRHFGITAEQTQRLFDTASGIHCVRDHPADEPGPAAYAELERRMEYLAGLIRKAGGTVPHSTKTHEGIPESVRAIFAEPFYQAMESQS